MGEDSPFLLMSNEFIYSFINHVVTEHLFYAREIVVVYFSGYVAERTRMCKRHNTGARKVVNAAGINTGTAQGRCLLSLGCLCLLW